MVFFTFPPASWTIDSIVPDVMQMVSIYYRLSTEQTRNSIEDHHIKNKQEQSKMNMVVVMVVSSWSDNGQRFNDLIFVL